MLFSYLLHFNAGTFIADPSKKRRLPPFIVVPFLLPLPVKAALRQFALSRFAFAATALYGSLLQRCGPQAHVFRAAQQQLQHLRVIETLYGLSVYVRDQIRRS